MTEKNEGATRRDFLGTMSLALAAFGIGAGAKKAAESNPTEVDASAYKVMESPLPELKHPEPKPFLKPVMEEAADCIKSEGIPQFQAILTFENLPGVRLYEVEVIPPVLEAEDIIYDEFHNHVYSRPLGVMSMSNFEVKVLGPIDAWGRVVEQLNRNQEITVVFPDGDSLVFYGYTERALPLEFGSNYFEAALSIKISNFDGLSERPMLYENIYSGT